MRRAEGMGRVLGQDLLWNCPSKGSYLHLCTLELVLQQLTPASISASPSLFDSFIFFPP